MNNTVYDVSAKFDQLYSRYSPKIYGFIRQYSRSKEEADEYLINVFCNLHKELNNLDVNDERTIQRFVLSMCKPLLKSENNPPKRPIVINE